MTTRECSIEGCGKPHRGLGYCRNHLYSFKVHGDPEATVQRLHWPETLTERLLPQPNGCVWHDSVPDDQGYARVARDGGQQGAHRAAYELFVGPIPPGMTIDHECHNRSGCPLTDSTCPHRRCVNPEHLVARSQGDNVNASSNSNAAKTHCPHGHPYDETNTQYTPKGDRRCRECNRLRAKAHHDKLRSQIVGLQGRPESAESDLADFRARLGPKKPKGAQRPPQPESVT